MQRCSDAALRTVGACKRGLFATADPALPRPLTPGPLQWPPSPDPSWGALAGRGGALAAASRLVKAPPPAKIISAAIRARGPGGAAGVRGPGSDGPEPCLGHAWAYKAMDRGRPAVSSHPAAATTLPFPLPPAPLPGSTVTPSRSRQTRSQSVPVGAVPVSPRRHGVPTSSSCARPPYRRGPARPGEACHCISSSPTFGPVGQPAANQQAGHRLVPPLRHPDMAASAPRALPGLRLAVYLLLLAFMTSVLDAEPRRPRPRPR